MNCSKWFVLLLFIFCSSVFPQTTQVEDSGTGTISGRVTNAGNQPMAGVSVLLLKLVIHNGYDPAKTRFAVTDPMGNYEFKNIPEGDYWVAVRPAEQNDPNGRLDMFYFPETMSGKDAYVLRVGPKAVLTAINVKCVPVKQGFEARGRVTDAVTGKPITNMRLTYGQTNQQFVRQDVQTDSKGFFIITRLDPGKYWVAINHEQSENYYCYPAYFEITAADATDLHIAVHKGVSLKGSVVLSKGIPETLYSDLNVIFHAKGISEVNQHATSYVIDRNMEKSSPVGADGTFMIKGLPPLIGTLTLRKRAGLPLENYFIAIEQNGLSIRDGLRIRDKDIEGVRISATEGTCKLKGKVKAAVNTMLDLERVTILISLQNDTVVPFSKKVLPGQNGEFLFEGLIPGKYTIMVVVSENGLQRRSGDLHVVQVRSGEMNEIELLGGY